MTAVDYGVLILRVVLGITIAAHGYNKIFQGGRIPGTAGWFDSIGMRPGKLHAWMAALTEVASGLLLAVGCLTPIAAAAVVAVMTVAAWTVHRHDGFFIVKGGWEYNLILAVAAVSVATIGPGRASIDHPVFGTHLVGLTGFLIAVILGLGSAVGQLVVFFRPPAPAADVA